jgi:hypothetical protein
MALLVFQHVCFEPAPNQADQARVSNSVLDELEHPFVTYSNLTGK